MKRCCYAWHDDIIISSSLQPWCTDEWGHVIMLSGRPVSAAVGQSPLYLLDCERIHADNGHSPWGKPIPSYDGSPARHDSSVAGLTSSPWCHPSQEMAELFRRSSYSPRPQGRGVHYGSESRCSNRTRCSGSMRNTSRDQVALAPSSGNQFRTTR